MSAKDNVSIGAQVLNYIADNGIVNQVSYGTAMGRESMQFYKDIAIKSMPYGQALAILFLLEILEDEMAL